MEFQELIINGRRVISQKDYAAAIGKTEGGISQNTSLPFVEFPNLRGRFIDLDKLALVDKESALKVAEITVPEANLYHYSHAEIGLFMAKFVADSQKYKADTSTMLEHWGKEVETLKAVVEKNQKDLGNALDRENDLRDRFEQITSENEKLKAEKENLERTENHLLGGIDELKEDKKKLYENIALLEHENRQKETLLSDTKHDNDLKVLEIKNLQTEKAGLEKALGEKTALLTVEQETSKGYFEQVKNLKGELEAAKTDLLKAQNTEKTAVFEKEKLEQQISFLQEKLENQAQSHAEQGKQFETLAKILEGNSRFTESFEIWFERNPNNPSNMRPLVKTSFGYFLATGKSVNPENDLVSFLDYTKILSETLLLEEDAMANETIAQITDSKEAPKGLKKQKGGAK